MLGVGTEVPVEDTMRRVLEEAEEVKQPSWVGRMVEGGRAAV